MQAEPNKAIEHIDGSVPILMEDYRDEAKQIISSVPKDISSVPIPNVTKCVNKLHDKVNMQQELMEKGKQLMSKEKDPKKVKKVRTKYNKVSDEIRRVLAREFEYNGGKIDIHRAMQIYGIKESTLRNLITKLRKGESIERKKVINGRHCILKKEDAQFLCDLYDNNKVSSDREAAEILNQRGIHISRRSVARLLTNGFMEEKGCYSLTCERVYYRGKDAESEENKTTREEVLALLETYKKDLFHPVFIDETQWSVGWGVRRRSRKGQKKYVGNQKKNYDVTAISAISDNGPRYITVFEGKSITADIFMDYMAHLLDQEKNRKVVFFMDTAPVHPKDKLHELIEGMSNKAIIFNAPYSPECNPIEKFFAAWKTKVYKKCHETPSQETLIKYIEDSFMEFTSDDCASIINTLDYQVEPKVVSHDDL